MSSEKRRKARIQGGWNSKHTENSNQKTKDLNPLWLAKNVDGTQKSKEKFVFQEVNEPIKPDDIVKTIDKPGVYDISEGPTGLSRIRFFPNFIPKDQSEQLMESLKFELQWRQGSDIKNGESYIQPRLTAWYGDLPYSYSGYTLKANTEWNPHLLKLKAHLEDSTGLVFNSVLGNLYRDGHDSVSWHSDDEPSLGPQPNIASLSFGDTRMFEMRKKPIPPNEDYREYVKIPLTAGSLLIMEGCVQEDWQHRIPKEYHDRDARINLTFRVILPE
ncbi:DgyrCDS2353 [Dimorphilus gyrociliatus]|uniref:Alpha-ketoglutarate-dependent dioxygenase alkB homolog 3 n=1 Tax=Dimorphilus gyrociliatus TaxID=2664684 RepID=A0A7I8VBZ8_9ANNE|nr:DgyrCDS2353 [Dimorphilus gyrociliatus]